MTTRRSDIRQPTHGRWVWLPVVAACLTSIALHAGAWMMTKAGGDFITTQHGRGWFTAKNFLPESPDPTVRDISRTGLLPRLLVENLDRSIAYVLEIDARTKPGRSATLVRVLVDGRSIAERMLGEQGQSIEVPIAPSASRRLVVLLSPGGRGADPPLDVIVEAVRIRPMGGHMRVTARVTMWFALAVLLATAALRALRLSVATLLLASTFVGFIFTWLMLLDAAFANLFVWVLVRLAIALSVVGAVVSLGARRASFARRLDEWSVPIAIAVGAVTAKLAIFAHPLASVADGIFQVHRAELVQAGTYYFTSVTPKPFFEFPYAIALYVTAWPFWRLFSTETGHVWLLRALPAVADAIIGLGLYAAIRRHWQAPATATLAVLLWVVADAPFFAFRSANLTNLFGDALFGIALIGVVRLTAASRPGIPVFVTAALLLTVAFLSHFGTIGVGAVSAGMIAVVLIGFGRSSVRAAGIALLLAVLTACAWSYAVYYRHFMPVYQQTLARISSSEGRPAAEGGVGSPVSRLRAQFTLRGTALQRAGWACSAGAVLWGAFVLWRRRSPDALSLTVLGWSLGFVLIWGVGILTAIQMRANLSAAPLFALLAATGLERGIRSGAPLRLAAAGVTALMIASGAALWLTWLQP